MAISGFSLEDIMECFMEDNINSVEELVKPSNTIKAKVEQELQKELKWNKETAASFEK